MQTCGSAASMIVYIIQGKLAIVMYTDYNYYVCSGLGHAGV